MTGDRAGAGRRSTPPRATRARADAGAFAALPAGTTPLVVYRAVDAQSDAAAVAAQIGFLAGVFEHAAFRVSAKGGDKAARAIAAQARDRFDLAGRRASRPRRGEPAGAFASRRDRLASVGGVVSGHFSASKKAHVTLPAWLHRPWPRPGMRHTPTGWKQPWSATHGGTSVLVVPPPQRFA